MNTHDAHIWTRVKLQYLAAIGGAALAVSGAIAVGGWRDSEARQASGSSHATTAGHSLSHTFETPQVVFYLVGSQAEADRAAFLEDHASWVRWTANTPGPSRTVHILFTATEAQAAFADDLIRDATESAEGVSFSYVDLRGRYAP